MSTLFRPGETPPASVCKGTAWKDDACPSGVADVITGECVAPDDDAYALETTDGKAWCFSAKLTGSTSAIGRWLATSTTNPFTGLPFLGATVAFVRSSDRARWGALVERELSIGLSPSDAADRATQALAIAMADAGAASAMSVLIARLADAGADVRKRYGQQKKTLLLAATSVETFDERDAVRVVRALLAAGADPRAVSASGHTALHMSTAWPAVVDALTSAGADVNASTSFDVTPLHIAAFKGHAHATEALVRAGAALESVGFDGDTPLFTAAKSASDACIEVLVRSGARATLGETNALFVLLDTYADQHDLDMPDRRAYMGRVLRSVRSLAAAGCDVNVCVVEDGECATPLKRAIAACATRAFWLERDDEVVQLYVDIVKTLHDLGADPNLPVEAPALAYAKHHLHPRTLALLVGLAFEDFARTVPCTIM